MRSSTLHLLPSRREIKIVYRDWHLALQVRSPAENVELQIQAAIRRMAMDMGELRAMPFEEVEKKEKKKKVEIDEELLLQARAARRFLTDLVKMEEKHDGDLVLVPLGFLCSLNSSLWVQGVAWRLLKVELSRRWCLWGLNF